MQVKQSKWLAKQLGKDSMIPPRVTTGPTNEDLCRSCVAGYSDNEIDTVFDGDHDAYWKYQLNILQDYE